MQIYGQLAWWREKYIYEENTRIRTALERGEKKGKKDAKLEDAKKMKEENLEIDLIIRITGLTKEEIERL